MEEIHGVSGKRQTESTYQETECRPQTLCFDVVFSTTDKEPKEDDADEEVIKVCPFETGHHAVYDDTVCQVVCLSDGWPGEILQEESGIEYITERPYECNNKD